MGKKKKDEKYTKKQYHQTIKTSLKSIIKNNNVIPKINEYVFRANQIIIQTYLFIRLYCLYKYHKKLDLPKINDKFVLYCMKSIGTRDSRGNKDKKDLVLKKDLASFYTNEFKPLVHEDDVTSYKTMTFMLPYLATQVTTGIDNNLKEHFVTRLRRYVHLIFGKEFDKEIKECKDKKLKNELKKVKWQNIRAILSDLMTNSLDKSNKKYHKWIEENRINLIPKTVTKNNVAYDVECNPSKYIKHSFYINEQIEKMNEIIEEEAKKEGKKAKLLKLFQPLSLRNSVIPKYINLDTASLVNIFAKKGEKAKLLKKTKKRANYIWQRLFKLEKKIFRSHKEMVFNHSISTDGVSVSILFVHKDIKDAGWGKKSKFKTDTEDYWIKLEDLTKDKQEEMKKRNIVGGDPGKSNMIYLIDNNLNKLVYTAPQRRFEIGAKKSRNIILTEKANKGINKIEDELSHHCCKTVNYENFKEFIKKKLEVNKKVFKLYANELFRKMRWRRFTKTQISEAKFLDNIERVFGSPNEVVIAYGDWSRNSQMKGHIPTKGKGLRRLISKRFLTITTKEYHTSKICNNCHNETDNLRVGRKSIHRLLSCKSKECQTIWNRDVNAGLNIMNMMKCFLYEGKRPPAFTRTD